MRVEYLLTTKIKSPNLTTKLKACYNPINDLQKNNAKPTTPLQLANMCQCQLLIGKC